MNFKLEARERIIIGRDFTEHCTVKDLEEILEADKENGWLWPSEVKAIRDLITFFDRDEIKKTSHKYGKGKNYGRGWSSRSLGKLCSRVKATVFNRRNLALKKINPNSIGLLDIDMVNGGFNIMYQVGLKLGIKKDDLQNMKLYLDKREEQLELVMGTFSVDKCLAKNLFIVLSYGGSVSTWINEHKIMDCKTVFGRYKTLPILDGIIAECILIGKEYLLKHRSVEDKFMANKPDNDWQTYDGNKYGIAISALYQDTEFECLNILLEECGMPNEAYLQHDGATINFDEVYEKTGLTIKEILPVVHSRIEQQLGITVKYEIKEFDKNPMPTKKVVINMDDFLRFDTKRFNEFTTFAEKKRYFEIFHCKIKMPDVRYIYQKFDRLSSKNNITPYTTQGFKDCYQNLFVDIIVEQGGKKSKVEVLEKTPFIPYWMKREDIREYDQYVFDPKNTIMEGLGYWNGIDNEYFNTFRGYSEKCRPSERRLSQSTKDAILEPWLEVVHELCGGVQIQTDAYLDFLSHMIQKPNTKAPMAFIIKSLQGIGKNVTLEPIAKMLNDYFITSSNIDDFMGDHANGFFQKILVNLNECQMNKNSFDYEGRIKTFITEDTISLNEKHEKRITVRNIARLLIFSQKPNPIPMDVKTGNRRFQVFQATDKYTDMDDEFWEERIELFNSTTFIPVLYEFLNTRDISKIKWKPILTQGYIEMCSQFIPMEVLFLEYFMTQNYTDEVIPSASMYGHYLQFAEKVGLRKEQIVTNPKLTNLLKDLEVGIEKKKMGGQSYLYLGDLKEVRAKLIMKELIRPDDDEEKPQKVKKAFKKLNIKIVYEDDIVEESKPIVEAVKSIIEEAKSDTTTNENESTASEDEDDDILESILNDDNLDSYNGGNCIIDQLFM
jgi:hypothetical protein